VYQQIVDTWYSNRETADVELVVCMDNIIVSEHITDEQRGAFALSTYNYLLNKVKTIEFDQYARSAVNRIYLDERFNECELEAFNWISYAPAYVELKQKWVSLVFLSPICDVNFITKIVLPNPNVDPLVFSKSFWDEMGPTVIAYTGRNITGGCRVFYSPQSPELMALNIQLVIDPKKRQQIPQINTKNSSRYGSKKKKNKNKKKNKKPIQQIEQQITECNCCLEEDEEIAWRCKTCKRGMICIKCVKPWMRKYPDHKCPCCRT